MNTKPMKFLGEDSGGGGGSGGAQAAARQAERRAEADRLRWEEEQRQVGREREMANRLSENDIAKRTQEEIARQQRGELESQAQQQAAAQAGVLSGAKGSATAIQATSPEALKLRSAGAFSLGPLAGLMKKKTLSQNNYAGTPNNINSAQLSLGGS